MSYCSGPSVRISPGGVGTGVGSGVGEGAGVVSVVSEVSDTAVVSSAVVASQNGYYERRKNAKKKFIEILLLQRYTHSV